MDRAACRPPNQHTARPEIRFTGPVSPGRLLTVKPGPTFSDRLSVKKMLFHRSFFGFGVAVFCPDQVG